MSFVEISLSREIHGAGNRGELLLSDGREAAQLLSYGKLAQCVYADPPFRTGNAFTRRQPVGEEGWAKGKPVLNLSGYDDQWSREEYIDFLRALAHSAQQLLKDSGVFYLHLDWRSSALGRLACDDVFGESAFMNEIIWAYESGGRSQRHFSRKHDTILMYAAGKKPRFDLKRVPTGRQGTRKNHLRRTMDEEGRPCRTIRSGGKIYRYYDDEPTYPTDVWTDIAHLQQRDPVRTGWPTQKPVPLLSRLLRPVCLPGDLVVDLCCGSGTTLAAALEEDFRFLGIERSPAACALIRKRLLGTDFLLELPCAAAPAELIGDVSEAGIVLHAYRPAPRLGAERMDGLTAVEQWSVGRIAGNAFHPGFSFARSAASPALPQQCFLPQGEGELAVEIIDLWGDKHLYLVR